MTQNAAERPLMVGRPNRPDAARVAGLLEEVWRSGHYTNFGPMEKRFQAELENRFSPARVLLYANGHLALESLLASLGSGGGEIVTTPFTFSSTLHAICNQGFTPVFADIEPDGVNIDPQAVEDAVTSRTRAVLGVHVYGVPCDLAALEEIGRRRGIPVIYDAAHSFGAMVQGKALAACGDASILSFHATKIFHSVEGGAVAVNRPDWNVEGLFAHRNFGLGSDGEIRAGGANGKMSEVHAAIGLANLADFNAEMRRRLEIGRRYDAALSGSEHLSLLPSGASLNMAYYPVFLRGPAETATARRDALVRFMNARNVFPRPYFSPSLDRTEAFRSYASRPSPHAWTRAASALCLPIFGDMLPEDEERVLSALAEGLRV